MVNIFRWFCIFTVTFVFLFGQSTLADGKPVFNCEYAVDYAAEAYANSMAKGYVPYVSRRPLSQLTTTPPPGDPYPEIEILPGFGNFTYNDDGDNADRPVIVYYYRPDNFPTSNSKVVFTMHGSARNAVSARDRIVPYADRYSALLIAPEFSRDFYPDADDYNRGFVKDGGGTGNLRSRSDWTFLTIEELFDIVLAEIPGAPSKYSIQGNSGAGQFISRIPLLVPEARFEVAAGSNSGWYTLPMRDELYPNGIGDLDISDAEIEQVYSKKVVTVVGEDDTDPNSYKLKHNDFTDAQGLNRYDRALFYHDYMGTDAAARGVLFNWDLLVVENVGHPADLMAHATAGAVFAGATTPADVALSPIDDTYIDESNPSEVFGASLDLRVDGGNQEMAFLKFDLSSVSAPVDVALLRLYITNGATGQQFVHEVGDNSWTESSLTWNNAPALGQEIGMTTGGEKEGILYVEVTDYINEKIGGLASLAFQSEDTDQLYFSSSEASYFPAQLVLFTGRLPVILSSFTSTPQNGSVLLEWRTESEFENQGFHIHRSTNEAGPYFQITDTLIPGAGTSPIPQDYAYLDVGLVNGITYYYKLEAIGYNVDTREFYGPVSAVPSEQFGGVIPSAFFLYKAKPTPFGFGKSTAIHYDLPVPIRLSLKIYDASGKLVKTLQDEKKPAGMYIESWDGRHRQGNRVSSGVYFYRLTSNLFTSTRKLIYLR